MIEDTQTVGDLAAEVPGATREFEKLGIDYCCGGSRTLGETCAQANIPVEQVLSRLQEGLTTAQPEAGRDWTKAPLADLIAHINGAHHVYIRAESPRIETLAGKVVGVHGKNHPELLEVQNLFSGLAEELSVHLMKEEQVLFPFIVRMEEAAIAGEPAPPAMFGTVANPVRMMMQEHDGAGYAIKRLREITKDYAVPADACISYATLYAALKAFEADIHQHIHLENNILFPRAVALEEKK
jgi:regulator of cell morphogenesis and NO signaling